MRTTVAFITLISIIVSSFCGCDQDDNCAPAYVDYIIIPADSLCFGTWEWIYTLKHTRPVQGGLSSVTDTIFPGDAEPGFETIRYARGTIGKGEICFNINGTVASGCYKYWTSRQYPTVEPTYVRTSYIQWRAPGHASLNVQVQFPLEPNDSIVSRILGLNMFEVSEEVNGTLFYRNWFVKVE